MTRNERIAYTAGMVSHSYHPQECPYYDPKLRAAYEKGLKDGKVANVARYEPQRSWRCPRGVTGCNCGAEYCARYNKRGTGA